MQLRFPTLNKVKPSEEKVIEERVTDSDMLRDENQTTVQPQVVETAPTRHDYSKFEENERYIVRTLTSLGIPLVLRSEQLVTLEEEPKRDILKFLEENERLKDALEKSGEVISEDEEYVLKSANFYHLTGNSQKALEGYEHILKTNPNKMAALNNKGVVLDYNGEYDNALKYFDEALSKVSENVHLLSNKGITLYKNEKYQQALDCFDMALKIDGDYLNALTFKAHSLYRLGKNSDALEGYNKVIRLDRDNAEALYNKACLCSLKGDDYGAITSLEKAIRLDPSWKEAALQDKDLDHIRNSPRFRNSVK